MYDTARNGDSAMYHTTRNGDSVVYLKPIQFLKIPQCKIHHWMITWQCIIHLRMVTQWCIIHPGMATCESCDTVRLRDCPVNFNGPLRNLRQKTLQWNQIGTLVSFEIIALLSKHATHWKTFQEECYLFAGCLERIMASHGLIERWYSFSRE